MGLVAILGAIAILVVFAAIVLSNVDKGRGGRA